MTLIKDLGMHYATRNSKKKTRFGLYQCECGKSSIIRTSSVKSGHTKRCSYCKDNRKHRLYGVWAAEKARCSNHKHRQYKHYGLRGVKVSDEFLSFRIWVKYIESLDNAYREGYTIDRIENDGNYERGNLRWASKSTQARNTRKIRVDNKSGFRGVCLHKQGKKWVAQISINGKNIHLGTFDYPWTAAYAYDSYIIKHNLEHTRNFKEVA